MPTRDPWATLPAAELAAYPHPRSAAANLPHIPTAPARTPFHQLPLPLWHADRRPALHCQPHCRNCTQPEPRCHCPAPAIACTHNTPDTTCEDCNPPSRNRTSRSGPIPIRIITGPRVVATHHTGAGGSELLAVHHCPYCGHAHRHTSHPAAHPYRISGCGKPYLLETAP